MRVGVLALQGAFAEHVAIIRRLEADTTPVRLPHHLEGLDGLIIPGGESTTMSGLMLSYRLRSEIMRRVEQGFPVLGTCAGMVLLAREVADARIEPVAAMAMRVRRNAFGRQRESFEVDLSIPVLGNGPFPGVFIRAPVIEQAEDSVEVLARLPEGRYSGVAAGAVVAARQGNLLACAFHPELTDDLRFHRYFLDIVDGKR